MPTLTVVAIVLLFVMELILSFDDEHEAEDEAVADDEVAFDAALIVDLFGDICDVDEGAEVSASYRSSVLI